MENGEKTGSDAFGAKAAAEEFLKLMRSSFDATFDNVGAIPEPATLAFVGIFGGGLLAARRFFMM